MGGDYFKFFLLREAIIRGRQLIKGRLLFEELLSVSLSMGKKKTRGDMGEAFLLPFPFPLPPPPSPSKILFLLHIISMEGLILRVAGNQT